MDDTVYEALRESHVRQRELCRRLLRARAGDRLRVELFRELRQELAAHAAAEERFLYAPILMDDRGLDPSRHAIGEHHEIDELVEALGKLSHAGDAWLEQARKLSHKVHHHLREEEKKFFQLSGRILTEPQKRRLGGRYRRDFERMKQVLGHAAP
ncbi:MAG TPA: hemerythrin domain-containing protein [Burkholderiaceae bacterium]|nr:hemerythrin domain-containing protein [Burkholderiaceae bacterium]